MATFLPHFYWHVRSDQQFQLASPLIHHLTKSWLVEWNGSALCTNQEICPLINSSQVSQYLFPWFLPIIKYLIFTVQFFDNYWTDHLRFCPLGLKKNGQLPFDPQRRQQKKKTIWICNSPKMNRSLTFLNRNQSEDHSIVQEKMRPKIRFQSMIHCSWSSFNLMFLRICPRDGTLSLPRSLSSLLFSSSSPNAFIMSTEGENSCAAPSILFWPIFWRIYWIIIIIRIRFSSSSPLALSSSYLSSPDG